MSRRAPVGAEAVEEGEELFADLADEGEADEALDVAADLVVLAEGVGESAPRPPSSFDQPRADRSAVGVRVGVRVAGGSSRSGRGSCGCGVDLCIVIGCTADGADLEHGGSDHRAQLYAITATGARAAMRRWIKKTIRAARRRR